MPDAEVHNNVHVVGEPMFEMQLIVVHPLPSAWDALSFWQSSIILQNENILKSIESDHQHSNTGYLLTSYVILSMFLNLWVFSVLTC